MMNTLIEYANFAADRWAAWVLGTSVSAAVLLALAGLLWLAIRRRVAPQVGYCLFLLVPLKLLVPVGVTVPAAIARWTPSDLVSSWFQGNRVPTLIDEHPAVEEQIAAVGKDRSIPREAKVASRAQSPPVAVVFQQATAPTEPPTSRQIESNSGAVARRVAEAPRLSSTAIAMIAWLAGILVLFARLVRIQRRFRAALLRSSTLEESRLPVDLCELCKLAGIRQSIRLVENDRVTAPAVWGIARPTIILPQGIASSLTPEQLRWVLLHELAHVRRRDLLVVAVQRFAAILHFFNPVVWIANRMIHRLREYACDDLGVSLGRASGVASGEAFLRILRHADRNRRGLEGALGVFGLDSRASCFLRIRRLLDTDRPIRTAPGAWSVCGLILLAAISLPHLRAAGNPIASGTQTPATPKASADEPGAKGEQAFELLVVGPDGKSVPEAQVELRTSPMPAAEQISQGKFLRKGPYGAYVRTDVEGRLVVKLPRAPSSLDVDITTPGFGPYWASWSSENHEQPIPARFTAELEAGWTVGGIVVDSAGKPVEGVEVGPRMEFKKRPGDLRQLGVGTDLKTDSAGKWRFDSIPVSMTEVFVEINHPGYSPVRRPLTRGEFGIERGREPAAKIVLNRGLTVSGRVTDETGKPIVGALVRTKFLNDIREARTGANGVYRLAGCEPRAARLVVSAKGRATDVKELNIESAIGPVDFQMKPGGTVRIRVLDEHGNPVPKARIFFQEWRGQFAYFEFGHVNQYADNNGVWVWNEAPLDEFKADICPPDGMTLSRQPLIARAEEYVFRTPPALVVSGKVIDAVTKKPIKAFRVVPGVRSGVDHMNWVPSQTFSAADGQFHFRETDGQFAYLFRVEADGFKSAVSRDIKSNEGKVSVDFALTKGTDVAAKVVTPRNLPAAGAMIALGVAGAQINVNNGDIDGGSTYASRETTDDAGRFHFSAQDKDFQLVITHPSGFGHIKSTPAWELTRIIHLEPWCRVEGTFRIGNKPAANVPLSLDVTGVRSYGNDVPSIFTTHYVTTRPDGRFVFEHVIPGKGWIGRRLMLTVNEGAVDVTSSCMMPAEFPAGKTVNIDLGGVGRAVVGKLRPPDGFKEKVRWNFGLVTGQADAPEARELGLSFTATIDRDGSFRIDDLPAGDYSLVVRFDRNDAGQLLLFDHRFKVPAAEGELPAKPVDLGTLTLGKR